VGATTSTNSFAGSVAKNRAGGSVGRARAGSSTTVNAPETKRDTTKSTTADVKDKPKNAQVSEKVTSSPEGLAAKKLNESTTGASTKAAAVGGADALYSVTVQKAKSTKPTTSVLALKPIRRVVITIIEKPKQKTPPEPVP